MTLLNYLVLVGGNGEGNNVLCIAASSFSADWPRREQRAGTHQRYADGCVEFQARTVLGSLNTLPFHRWLIVGSHAFSGR